MEYIALILFKVDLVAMEIVETFERNNECFVGKWTSVGLNKHKLHIMCASLNACRYIVMCFTMYRIMARYNAYRYIVS